MNQSVSRFVIAIAAVVGLCAGANGQRVEEGFVPLFNGKDLAGWHGNSNLWKVENGEIVGSTEGVTFTKNSFLMTDNEYSDFVLRIKVKLRNNNSGIQIRSLELPEFAMKGYQADLAEKTYFGMLYEEQGRGFMDYWKKLSPEEQAKIHALGKQGDWNEFEVRCEGDRIQITLNGVKTCDIQDPDGAKRGRIGLQLHVGPPMEVRFKDISIMELAAKAANADASAAGPELKAMPRGKRFQVAEGFDVQQVASEDLTGSSISMTFDHAGRPFMGVEGAGARTLVDDDGDGKYDRFVELSDQVKNVQGLYELEKGVYLIQGSGPDDKTGVFRVTDNNDDLVADSVEFVLESDRGMGEHGPHAIRMGMDGDLYIMYGNHSYPKMAVDPASPSRGMQEDNFLPRWWDPRGHAVDIIVPGGTLQRIDTGFTRLEQFTGGFRNAYDFDIDATGEIFTFDSDMEWDVGLPWFRPVRVAHLIPGADYGWRSGSSNPQFYIVDSLPSVDDIGRGSPVGTVFYDHNAYPLHYRGAYFMGDWSRGRVRVIFPQRAGATYSGKTQDFVVGEPLNVTDLDVGPDGALYFTTGGRRTTGGLYRVISTSAGAGASRVTGVAAAMAQPMPRSAWGKERIREIKTSIGAEWDKGINAAVQDKSFSGDQRVRGLELMQVLGPQPSVDLLGKLAVDPDADVRAAAVYLMGKQPLDSVKSRLTTALSDTNAMVARRACESFVRAGLSPEMKPGKETDGFVRLLDHQDRFVRTAARVALTRVAPEAWADKVLQDDIAKRPNGAVNGLLTLIQSGAYADHHGAVYDKLVEYAGHELSDDVLLDLLRVVQMSVIRGGGLDGAPAGAVQSLQTELLPKFPHQDWRVNRELQVTLAGLQTTAAIDPMLTRLEATENQQEQVHTAYALRAIRNGWTKEQRDRMVGWFDRGWELEGGASFEGYVNNIWEETLTLLPEDEKEGALKHRGEFMAARAEKARALMAELDAENKGAVSDLAQRDFTEIAEYLEYDPMAYREPNLASGERVFMRARCAECHVFGTIGKGGGPDLTSAAGRFTRRDMLEAIMYPSKVISDQYVALDIELKDGSFFTGMPMSENDSVLTIMTPSGERKDLKKSDIDRRDPSQISVMPEGLVETMNFGQLVELIHFLEAGNGTAE